MLTLALVGTALAASPAAELSTLMNQDTRPAWAVACSPVSDVIELMKVMPLDDGRPASVWGENQRMILPLLADGAMDKAGIDATGPLIISGHSKRGKIGNSDVLAQFSIPFSGTAEQAHSLITTIEPKATSTGPGTWQHAGPKESLTIRHTENAIVVSSDLTEPNKVTPIAELLTGLPDTPGCAVFALIEGMDSATQMRSKRLKMQGLSIFIPTQGGATHFRLKTGLALDADLDGAEIETLLGSSTTSPTATMLWAMDPIELISAVVTILPPIKPVKEMQRALSEEERPIQIPPGMVTVGFEKGSQKGFGAIIPVHSRKGKKIWAGTLAKGLTKLLTEFKAPVTKVSRTRLAVGKTPDKTVHIATKRGLIYLASTSDLLEEMLSGEGKPWVSTELQAMAKTAALAAEVELPPSETAPAMDVRAGLSLKEGLWEVELQMNVPAAKSNRWADILDTVLTLNPKMRSKLAADLPGEGPEQELVENIELLAGAVNTYNMEHKKYMAAKPWPREVIELTSEAVPWKAKRKKSKDFEKLKWAPEGDVKGTYWVEIDEPKNAFTVFGAMDADGDGVPVIYKWCHNCESDKPAEVQRVTEPGVY